ncbi:hypothetical protein QP968_00670 [Corynebacterium sp. MSK041]|uniref:hypothetical protein n=1 Tax=Corynebacterium sp. MSK041 TaxID=3050194 RepID=UPI00254F2C8D|nr:hypothetical protein [Corynebacterium sp. MSK041]MDK8794226.1 hypothetical protein [Corynebacterium sp. MSK041]
MTVTEWELRQQARQLADAYATLQELKWTPPRPPNVKVMRSQDGPRSPIPDNDWVLNLEYELTRDTPDESIPGGLRTIACDALSYTTAKPHTKDGNGYLDDPRPGILCAHIAFQAQVIAEDFPAAEDLMEIMGEQDAYIRRCINKRFGGPAQIQHEMANVRPTGYGTAADIAPLVSAAIGRTITRKQITWWGRSGRITQHLKDDGTSVYELAEAIDAAKSYRDGRRRTALD